MNAKNTDGQTLRAHLFGEAKPPIVLHSARLGGVGGRKARRRGLLLKQNGRHVAAAQFDCQRQSARAASDDDDGAILLSAHFIPRVTLQSL